MSFALPSFSAACLAASLLAGLVLGPAPSQAAVDMPPGVAWQAAAQDSDIEAAFARAKAEQKPVLLYWGATWCPPCNQLKATLFNRADFIEQSRSVVPVQVDGDLPGAQKLGARFKVRGYPTLILFSPNGQELTRLPGEADAPRVVKLLQLGLAGGRPIDKVLADARSGKKLKPSEWQLLSFYSWETDHDQLVKERERAGLLRQLAESSRQQAAAPDVRVRLQLKALASSGEQNPALPDALRLRWLNDAREVLAQPKQVFVHMDVLTNFADDVVKGLFRAPSPERNAFVARFTQSLTTLSQDPRISRADRVQALRARVLLARLDEPTLALTPNLPTALLTEVRGTVHAMDRDIRDGYERQAVITAAASLLTRAGLWDESDALLKANLGKSHSPYYLMSMLGSNARRQGRAEDALRWYEQSFTTSRGPATRLQWGSGYFKALVELAPHDSARIEQVASQLFAEAAKDKGSFHERSERSLHQVGSQLVAWANGVHAPVLTRLQTQLSGVCGELSGSEKASCNQVLRKRG